MAITEDLTPFFDTVSGFGESVTYEGSSINVIFDNAFVESVLGDAGVETRAPSCVAKETDVSSAAHGDVLVRGGTTYHVVGVHPDGMGCVILVLEKQ